MYLYLITNTVNGKQYVGITTQSLAIRWRDHVAKARRGEKRAIARAIRKYGCDAFTRELLAEASSWEELARMEQDAIALYNTFIPHGYNMTHGGDGILGFTHSETSKVLMSEHRRGIPVSEEFRAAVGTRMRGIPKSDAQRHKIRAAQLGEKNHRFGKTLTEDHKQRLREAHTGNTYGVGHALSPEVRAYLSSIRKGKTHTVETKAKIAAGHRGKPRDGATRTKVSVSMKVYYETHTNPMQGRQQSATTRALIRVKARARGHAVVYKGVHYPSIADAVEATGLTRNQIAYALKKGYGLRKSKKD